MPYYIEIDTEIDHRGDGGGVVFSVYNTSLVRCDEDNAAAAAAADDDDDD